MDFAKLVKRLDDMAFIAGLADDALSIIIVPHKNKLVAWFRPDKLGKIEHMRRLVKVKRLRNGLVVACFKLSL